MWHLRYASYFTMFDWWLISLQASSGIVIADRVRSNIILTQRIILVLPKARTRNHPCRHPFPKHLWGRKRAERLHAHKQRGSGSGRSRRRSRGIKIWTTGPCPLFLVRRAVTRHRWLSRRRLKGGQTDMSNPPLSLPLLVHHLPPPLLLLKQAARKFRQELMDRLRLLQVLAL